MAEEEEPDCCPLCMEELDITDQTFNACPCGYQVCLWCWHQIKNEYNGLCPACRQPYAELSKQKNPLDREDVVRRTKARRQKEKNERRTAAQAKQSTVNRKSLQNVRVMQRNLVYGIFRITFREGGVPRYVDGQWTVRRTGSASSSFASIDAIFSQRNESSEALAGLLGVQLEPTPLTHGAPLAGPPKDAHTSRFSFANPMDIGMQQQSTARYELLDGTKVNSHSRNSFSSFDTTLSGNAGGSAFPPTTDRSGFPPLGSSRNAPLPPHPSRSSFGGDFRGSDLPLSGSGALSGEPGTSSGLAFLQEMLPNVNISFGDYPSMACGPGTSGIDAARSNTPVRSSSAGRGHNAGRRLFERSQSAGGGLTSPDAWDGGSLNSLGFEGQISMRQVSSATPSFYDPTLAPQTPNGFSNDYYGFGSSSSMAPNGGDSRLRNEFGGEAYRHSSSLINNS
ncbi:hypothetical protein BBJ29_003813 [Phytophthora kernoviae]|uniref:RING-type domain-containing protein n=1 Tax=Phytophthora kernoviae TaxID=325452 RepID=A0A3F2RKG6_9STRA|nr:hypothetical protein BBP00_00006614 [Phytophthora kernoviae]RLN61418.1 hypothetical protein BBJ29_003813 [Phytophthora kernoviae]